MTFALIDFIWRNGMHPTHQERPAPTGLAARTGRILIVAMLLVGVAACNGKTSADKASDELAAGLTAAGAGDTNGALTHYKACVALDSTNKFCIFNIGVRAQADGNLVAAENDYRLALLLDPDFGPALYNLAILRTNAGGFDEALALYRHLIQVDPSNANGHFNLGLLLAFTGDKANGLAELQKGVSLNAKLVIPSPLPGPSASPSASPSPTPSPSPSPTPSATPSPSPS